MYALTTLRAINARDAEAARIMKKHDMPNPDAVLQFKKKDEKQPVEDLRPM